MAKSSTCRAKLNLIESWRRHYNVRTHRAANHLHPKASMPACFDLSIGSAGYTDATTSSKYLDHSL